MVLGTLVTLVTGAEVMVAVDLSSVSETVIRGSESIMGIEGESGVGGMTKYLSKSYELWNNSEAGSYEAQDPRYSTAHGKSMHHGDKRGLRIVSLSQSRGSRDHRS